MRPFPDAHPPKQKQYSNPGTKVSFSVCLHVCNTNIMCSSVSITEETPSLTVLLTCTQAQTRANKGIWRTQTKTLIHDVACSSVIHHMLQGWKTQEQRRTALKRISLNRIDASGIISGSVRVYASVCMHTCLTLLLRLRSLYLWRWCEICTNCNGDCCLRTRRCRSPVMIEVRGTK